MKISKHIAIGLLSGVLMLTSACAIAAEGGEAKKVKLYPLEICLVTGEKLGGMGKPVVINHEGQEIKFCCKGCVKSFTKEPAKYLKKMEEEVKAGKKAESK